MGIRQVFSSLIGKKADPVLQSPAGGKLRRRNEEWLCSATGKIYNIRNGSHYLFDKADVSPFLDRDYHWFKTAFDRDEGPTPEYAHSIMVYEMAKKLNTEFMFSHLTYQDPGKRRVLEIGVGNAKLISRFADMGFQAYALDYFTFEMDKAHKAHVEQGGKPFNRVSAPMSRLPFQKGSFDLVYMHAALHHALPNNPDDFRWSDPMNLRESLAEIKRILKPEGAFFLLGEGVYPDDVIDRYWERACKESDVVYESWYTLPEYEQAFEAAGAFPTIWVDQENHRARVIVWENGERQVVTNFDSHVTLDEYHRLFGSYDIRLPKWVNRVTPG